MQTLEELLTEEMRDLYSAEKQLVKALPKMAKAASSDELREALTEHLEVTKKQVERLEQAFEKMGQKARAKTCKGMQGLIEEGSETMQEDAEDTILDLAIIGAAQRVEHYEMAAYGTARTIAERLEMQDVAELLAETLAEEEEADEKLTEVANGLYDQASEGGEEDEEIETEEADEPAHAGRGGRGR